MCVCVYVCVLLKKEEPQTNPKFCFLSLYTVPKVNFIQYVDVAAFECKPSHHSDNKFPFWHRPTLRKFHILRYYRIKTF